MIDLKRLAFKMTPPVLQGPGLISQKIHGNIQYLDPLLLSYEFNHLTEHLIGKLLLVSHHRNPQGGSLPKVVVTDFRYGNVESVFYPVFDSLEEVTFAFQRAAFRNMNLDAGYTDYHKKIFSLFWVFPAVIRSVVLIRLKFG
jgi:hypothetical protein